MEDRVEYRATMKSLSTMRLVALIVLISMLASTASLIIYDRFFALKIVAFDITGFITSQKKQFYEGKITETELLRSLDEVDELLNRENKTTLILNSNAVIRNAKLIKP